MKSFLLCLVASTTLAAPDLEVHEWGTFTSISDGNGVATKWLARSEDLPAFVYHSQFGDCRGLRSCIESFESKSRMRALVRMETPVIYFYTPTPMDVSLKVGFPNGRMTEWYPAVWNSTPHLLDWGTFRVDPTKNPVLPKESSPNHYYAAREVDAAPVLVRGREFSIDGAGCQNRQFEFTRGRSGEFCVTTKQTEEWERYLFYRGVGDFEPLVNATLTKTEVFVRPTRALGHALLFERRGESVGLTPLSLDGKAQAIRRPALSSTPQDVRKAMVALLLETGLFEKEALAMVKTWDDSWFTEGVRVFYVVPSGKDRRAAAADDLPRAEEAGAHHHRPPRAADARAVGRHARRRSDADSRRRPARHHREAQGEARPVHLAAARTNSADARGATGHDGVDPHLDHDWPHRRAGARVATAGEAELRSR